MIDPEQVTAVILAGGKSERYEKQHKGLVKLLGKPSVVWIAEKLKPFCKDLFINSNGAISAYEQLNFKVWPDHEKWHQLGPLSGIYTSLLALETKYLLTIPCDSPCFSTEVLQLLLTHAPSSCADAKDYHPLFCCLQKNQLASLDTYLQTGQRRCQSWMKDNTTVISFKKSDYFLNMNSLADKPPIERALC